MLSLEVKLNANADHWTNITKNFLNITSRNHPRTCKHWRTMKGVENYIAKAIETYPWLTRESFRVNGTEEQRRQPRHINTTGMEVHEGDIFVCSWGYSMVLVDFYQVTKVSKTGKTINVRQLATEIVNGAISSPQGGYVAPIKDRFIGEELKNKRIKGDYGVNHRPMFTVNSFSTAHLIDEIDPNGYFMCDWD